MVDCRFDVLHSFVNTGLFILLVILLFKVQFLFEDLKEQSTEALYFIFKAPFCCVTIGIGLVVLFMFSMKGRRDVGSFKILCYNK